MPCVHSSESNPNKTAFEACDKHLKTLTEFALQNKSNKRPCVFFHYTGLMRERLSDCVFILERMDVQRARLAALDRGLDAARRDLGEWPPGAPYPENIQKIMRAQDRLTKGLRLDFETLYLFGMMLLDQLALIAKCVGGISINKKHPFNEIIEVLESGKGKTLQSLWNTRAEQFLWLFHNFRVFRNVFVAHPVEAWQRGSSRAVHGTSFTMFIPSPPGHRGDEEVLNEEIYSLLHLAPERIRNAPADYWERARPGRLLDILLDQIGTIPMREDRLKIERLYKRRGGETPTYQTVGSRLLTFCEKSLEDILALIKESSQNLDLEYVDINSTGAR